jgi:putative phosphoribosyl transferase
MTMEMKWSARPVTITVGGAILSGELAVPPKPIGLVIVPHGSGSSRLTPRNRRIAQLLNDARLGTLTVDLLTPEEEVLGDLTGAYRTDAALLTDRITEITDWTTRQPKLRDLAIAYVAAGSAAPAAFMATAQRPNLVRALVVRGGRLDPAYTALGWDHAPTLLIAAEHDAALQAHYRMCLDWITSPDLLLVVVPRASAAFSEPHTLDDMMDYTVRFLVGHLGVRRDVGHGATGGVC